MPKRCRLSFREAAPGMQVPAEAMSLASEAGSRGSTHHASGRGSTAVSRIPCARPAPSIAACAHAGSRLAFWLLAASSALPRFPVVGSACRSHNDARGGARAVLARHRAYRRFALHVVAPFRGVDGFMRLRWTVMRRIDGCSSPRRAPPRHVFSLRLMRGGPNCGRRRAGVRVTRQHDNDNENKSQ